MQDPSTQFVIENIVKQCIRKAEHSFQRSFDLPTWNFNVRGKVAGKAYLKQWEIRLNPALFQENKLAFLQEVIPHEVAHLITYQCFGRVKPHGKEWQYVMESVLGIPAKTTHCFDVTGVQGKTFEYQCGCQIHPLSIRRHNKVLRKNASYRCKICLSELSFTGTQLS